MENRENNKQDVTLFAKTNFRNQEVPFGIKTDDRRRHMYVIGKTGMGKTTMMENMIIQDIINGHGVAFVDPHGDSVEKILSYIPSNRVNDVIYINPSDLDYPIAFNILESVDTRYKHLVASGLMGVFTKIWADMWSARMAYILNNSILALLDSPGNTLLGIARILIDKKYRKKIVDAVKDPMVKSFWMDEYANWSEKYRTEAIAAIQNKVGQFLATGVIRNIVGQPKSTIDLREVMDNKKILLLNLAKGKVGEDNSALLGAMIITKLQLAALSRVDVPEAERNDFYLYVDEFQNFATESFATILSEARKYRLNLTIGHQYIGQLVHDKNTKVRDAVFGNVGTIVCFRVGAADAEFLEKEFAPGFTETDLVNIPKYHVLLKLMINGVASDPFTAVTLAPSHYERTDNAEKVIRVSRERYANPVAEVEDKINRWMGQEYHEQVAVISGAIPVEEEIATAVENIAASLPTVPQAAPQQQSAEARAPLQSEQAAPTPATRPAPPQATLPPMPIPRSEQDRRASRPQVAQLKQERRQNQDRRERNFHQRSGSHGAGNLHSNSQKKENPIWSQVTQTREKSNSRLAEDLAKTLYSKPQHNTKREEQRQQEQQPRPEQQQPQPQRSEQRRIDSETEQKSNGPIILKPGESHKIGS